MGYLSIYTCNPLFIRIYEGLRPTVSAALIVPLPVCLNNTVYSRRNRKPLYAGTAGFKTPRRHKVLSIFT